MSKPATEMRLQRASEGFTEVIGRGNAHIITRDPVTKKCAYDGQVGGGWHYGAGLETDTAWEQDAVAAYLKMVKAGYNLRARKLFNAGDLVQWTDPISGQYVKFQPVNFQWIDSVTGSNSLISVAQAVASPSVDDDKLYWPAAFGTGRHFRYTAAPTKLIKHLIIDSAANIPACPAYITNPWLELTFTLTPSSGVIMFVDGVAWDKATTKTTANAIEFRLPSGQVVWSMAAPLAYDSSEMGEPCAGQIKLYVNKKIKYAAIRFSKSWIDSAVFPIVLDPTVDYQVAASANDARYGSTLNFTATTLYLGLNSVGDPWNSTARWKGVTIPSGATVDVATILLYYSGMAGTPGDVDIKFVDEDDPAVLSSVADLAGRDKTTAHIMWTPTGNSGWFNAIDVQSIIAELVASYNFSAGKAMIVDMHGSAAQSNWYAIYRSYDYAGNTFGPKLHIEYTEAAAGGSPRTQVIWI